MLDRAEVERRLGTGPGGLAGDEAARRLAEVGPNRLEEVPPPTAFAILLHQFTSPLIYILLPIGDRFNMAYAESIVARGRGRGLVVATGMGTELGAIAGHVRRETQPRTPLQHRMDRFAKIVGLTVAVSAVGAFGVGVLIGEPASEMFLVAVAMAVSAVPEGLPVVMTISLAIGVRRMARRRAIIRRLPAVETLGSTNVIGTDKTGTLTENRMTVQQIWAGGASVDPAGQRGPAEGSPLFLTLAAGAVANEAKANRTPEGLEFGGDPTEVALLAVADRMGVPPDDLRRVYPVELEVPFEPDRQYSAAVGRRGGELILFVKGAPERVLGMCTHLLTADGPVPLDEAAARRAVQEMADAGLRVLAMACRTVDRLPDGLVEGKGPQGLLLLGLQGMHDPPRAGVPEAVAGCQGAGIRVVMITGDHAATARHIGADVGIVLPGAPVLTGVDLDGIDDAALADRVGDVAVYARVSPEHKLRVVRALRSRGQVVAVTGDGVNDAPALRAADIGIAMGQSGTDVAREASDMVLTDDNFVSIYAAVEEGRTTTMVLFQMFQAGNARSDTRSLFRLSPLSNPFLFVAVAAALAVHIAALYWGPTQFVLRLEPIPAALWPRMAIVASSILLAVEAHKLVRRRRPYAPRARA